ncbi:MAG TPA: hypothetical protein VGH29_17665 [Candidatus Binataceae bacterium]
MAIDWASRDKTRHSYELFARYVAPIINNNLGSIPYSRQWTAERRPKLMERGGIGVALATEEYLRKQPKTQH